MPELSASRKPPKTPATSPPDRRAAQVKPAGAASPPPPTGEAAGLSSSSLKSEAPQAAARMPGPVAGSRPTAREPDRERANTCNTASRGAKIPAAGSPKTPARGMGASPVSLAGLQAAAMSEAELEEQIRDACKKLGVIRIHIYHARGTTPGVPDDILIGPCGVMWRELKTMTGKVSPAQRAMGEALKAAGQDFAVWRPVHLLSGRIARELAALAGLRTGAA